MRVAVLLFALLLTGLGAARAEDKLVIDISSPMVAITAGFAGEELLLFGAMKEPGDVVVVVRGPSGHETVRRKERVVGMWLNRSQMEFEYVPGFYAVGATRPLDEILAPEVRARHRIGLENLTMQPVVRNADWETIDEFREALIRNKVRQGLYNPEVGKVALVENVLLRTDIYFPSNVPTGNYTILVHLVKDGRIVSSDDLRIKVGKVGFEAQVYGFAHEQAWIYGVVAILLAVAAGWLADAVFRKA